MFNFLPLFNLVLTLNVLLISAQVPKKILCGNENCTKIIGYGKTKLVYHRISNDQRILSFGKGVDVEIYSKSEKKSDYWGVKINNKRGFVPPDKIHELNVVQDAKIVVDTDSVSFDEAKVEPNETPQPTKTYEVVDGTTLYYETEKVGQSNGDTGSSIAGTEPLHSKVTGDTPKPNQQEVKTDKHEDTKTYETNKDIIQQTAKVDDSKVNTLADGSIATPEDVIPKPKVENDANTPEDVVPSPKEENNANKPEDVVPRPKVETDSNKESITQTAKEHDVKKQPDVLAHKFDGDDDDEDEDDEASVENDDADDTDAVDVPKHSNQTQENEKPENNVFQTEPQKDVFDQTKENVVKPPSNEQPKKEDSLIDTGTAPITTVLENPELHNETDTEPQGGTATQEVPQVEFDKTPLSNEGGEHITSQNETQSQSDTVDTPIHIQNETVPTLDILGNQEATNNSESVSNENESATYQVNDEKAQGEAEESKKHEDHNDDVGEHREQSFQKFEIPYHQTPEVLDQENQEIVKDDSNLSEQAYDNSYSGGDQEEVVAHVQQEETQTHEETTEEQIQNTETPKIESHKHDFSSLISQHVNDELSCSADPLSDCKILPQAAYDTNNILKFPNPAILTVLVVAAVTVVTFLWGYMYMEKRGRESNLVGKINNIQKDYLIVKKENEILKDKLEDVESEFNEKASTISSEMLEEAQKQLEMERNTRTTLETQIRFLEKELENSMEVGMELNKILSEFFTSENGSETLVANVNQLQRQIVEQQGIINTYNENLSMKETENHELRLEVVINNAKVDELQNELNKLALNLLKVEEDKEHSQSIYESELEKIKNELSGKEDALTKEKNKSKEMLQDLKDKYEQVQRDFELKSNEYALLKENVNEIKKIDSVDALKSLFDVSAVQAELLQLRKEKQTLLQQLQDERNKSDGFEARCRSAVENLQSFKEKYDEADREKVEAVTKLAVLDKYFKEREAQLQKELNKQESMWVEKQGEASSTIERIKYMQEELQNYKTQNESLTKEILEQEVQMKSQISVLERKAHENWVSARQAERKVEEAKQEAAQLRNRLTLRERSFAEEKMHNRVQSPLEQNGEMSLSPAHIANDSAVSPPLLYGTRENLTMSPPLGGLPFLPPPPGAPFMPLGGVPLPPPRFMPPPPSLMPGDHRPPPLGRISSPPLNSRYSPDRGYSPYSRNTPSPVSDDDYDRMSPVYRGYNSYGRDDRREMHRPPPVRPNARINKGGGHSSGSANSNDSLDKINRHNSKV